MKKLNSRNRQYASLEKFCVYGDATVDFKVKIPRGLKIGEDGLFLSSIDIVPAGDAGTVAQQIALLGPKVAFVGSIGNDLLGKVVEKRFRELGINVAGVRKRKGETGRNIIFRYPNTRRSIISCLGVHTKIDNIAIKTRHMFVYIPYFPSYIRLFRKLHKKILYRHMHTQVITDLGFSRSVINISKALKLLKGMINTCSISGEHFTAKERDSIANLLQKNEITLGLLTLGNRGVLAVTEKTKKHFPAYKVNKVVETNGAGNSFISGFLVAVSEGKNLAESVAYGQATAALKVQMEGLPTRKDVAHFIKRNN